MVASVSLAPFEPMGAATTASPATDLARIGPNAVIQLATAMSERLGRLRTEPWLRESTGYTFATLPSSMIDEREAQALVHGLLGHVGPRLTADLLHDAGQRTGDYLLANRIPLVARWGIRAAPRRVGLRLLLRAMQQHAWTFAGSGHFIIDYDTAAGRRGVPDLIFESCSMCRDLHEQQPMCDFYGGTFERLIRRLVARFASVQEVECIAKGDARCRFVLEGIA
jgi:divinyl protochlorophyllide a 8-vinyl-reductase